MSKVCILDYGSGNTKSVFNLFKSICSDVLISNEVCDIEAASHIVLPGVGAFGSSMKKINETIPMEVLQKQIFTNKIPFLGICVGMQVMSSVGFEFEENKGLDWISGEVRKIDVSENNLPLPHVGWNSIKIVKQSKLFDGIEDGTDFYFVHSYIYSSLNSNNIISTTEYGETFCSAIQSQNLFGVQFHPEKSHIAGKRLIQNFISIE